ncbi:hypothetical protein P9869_24385 [Streptomyces ossamyceticus]|nr:hypothetical protein [Streptomyces ossamyceticus]
MLWQGAGGQVGYGCPGHHLCEVAAYAFGFTAYLGRDVAALVDEAAEDGGLLKHDGIMLSFQFPADGAGPEGRLATADCGR